MLLEISEIGIQMREPSDGDSTGADEGGSASSGGEQTEQVQDAIIETAVRRVLETLQMEEKR